jgi:hypothetical protein
MITLVVDIAFGSVLPFSIGGDFFVKYIDGVLLGRLQYWLTV